MNRQAQVLTKGDWRSFALTAEELDYLHQLILDVGIPEAKRQAAARKAAETRR